MRRASPFIFLFLAACSSRVSLDSVDGASTSLPPSDKPDACLADLERTSAPMWERGHACDAGSLGDAIGQLAIVRFDLVGITGAGPRVVHHFFEGQDIKNASATDVGLAVRGDYVAATVTRMPNGIKHGEPIQAETVLFRRDGTLVKQLIEEGPWISSVGLDGFFLSDRGIIVAGRRFEDDIHTYAARDTGVLAKVPLVRPIAEPAPSGRVAVRASDPYSSDVTLSWLDPCSGELLPSRENARALHTTVQTWGHRLVYVDDVDPTQLMIEDPEGATAVDLGEEGELIEIHPAGQALLGTSVEGRVLVADLNAHTARAITIQSPPGWSPMTNARPASDGRLYRVMRTSAIGSLQVTKDGSSWTPLGVPIGEVFGASARETNGTFYLYGNINAFMLPPWDPAPAGTVRLDYNSVQVAREDGTGIVLKNPPAFQMWLDDFRLATDGGCISNGNNGGLETTNLSSGAVTMTPLDPAIYDPVQASSFVPGDDMMPWY